MRASGGGVGITPVPDGDIWVTVDRQGVMQLEPHGCRC
jgi:hypothetical protein